MIQSSVERSSLTLSIVYSELGENEDIAPLPIA
jgi:hypothetical protein